MFYFCSGRRAHRYPVMVGWETMRPVLQAPVGGHQAYSNPGRIFREITSVKQVRMTKHFVQNTSYANHNILSKYLDKPYISFCYTQFLSYLIHGKEKKNLQVYSPA